MQATSARRWILHTLAGTALALGTPSRGAGPVPRAPEGIPGREVSTFGPGDQEPVRIAAHPDSGRLYVLGGGGDVSLLDPEAGTKRRVLSGRDYIEQPKDQDLNIPLPPVDAALVNSPVTLRATLCLGLAF